MIVHWFYKHFGSHWGCCLQSRSSHVAGVRQPGGLPLATGTGKERASAEALPEGCASKICSDVVTVYMMLKGVVNFAEEIPRMEKKAVGLAARQAKLQAQLDDPERMAKATQESKFKAEKDLADAGAFLKELNEGKKKDA